MLQQIGHHSLRLPRYSWALLLFMLHCLKPYQLGRSTFNKATMTSLRRQLLFTGVDAMPSVTLLAAVLGFGVVAPMIMALELVMQPDEVVVWVSELVLLQLSGLIAAIVIVGRTGTAISVDLGSMKLNRELEGLELLGINTAQVLIAPRLLAAMVAQVVLATYVGVIAVLLGVFGLSLYNHAGYAHYMVDIAQQIHPYALVGFVAKNLLFGLLIAAIACWHGLQVQGSRNALPQQAARAVVNALATVLVLNGVLATVGFLL